MAQAASSALDPDAALVRTRGLQRSEHRLLLTIGDAVCAAAGVLLALWAWSITTGFAFNAAFLRRSVAWLLVVPIWMVLLAGSRRLPSALSLESTARSLFRAAAALLVLYAAAYFYAPPQALPRLPALYFLWEVILLTLGWRIAYLYVFTRAGFRRRAIVIGTGAPAARIVALLRELSPDVDVIAVVGEGPASADAPGALADKKAGHYVLTRGEGGADVPAHSAAELNGLVTRAGVAEIVVAEAALSPALVHDLLRWQERGVSVIPMAAEYEQLLMRVPVAHLPPDWMFSSLSEWVRVRDASNAIKRLLDIAGAVAGLIVLVVLLPIVAFAVWLDSGRPIFYRQTRLGTGGRAFRVLKFRSMVRDAEEEGPRWAGARDARATRVGRWLRRSRLDELPQVINVLRGEMSLVGPRPERPEFVEQLEQSIPVYRARLMVRPGLTGWAQVNTDYAASAEDASLKLEYDLYYIKHRSLLFDVWILAKTATTLLAMRGR